MVMRAMHASPLQTIVILLFFSPITVGSKHASTVKSFHKFNPPIGPSTKFWVLLYYFKIGQTFRCAKYCPYDGPLLNAYYRTI